MRARLMASRQCVVRRLLPILLLVSCGCQHVPSWQYRQSQISALQQYRKNRLLASQLQNAQQLAAQYQAENQQLQARLQAATNQLSRLGSLQKKYRDLLTGLPGDPLKLPGPILNQFQQLMEKYPQFDFDSLTGVSKFHGDLLFASGSDEIRPEGEQLLQEFARIMNDPIASQFKILVVGHTDDVPIRKPSTRKKHETNWDLSAHRATAVTKRLAKLGMDETRLGIAGYSKYQPKQPNLDDQARQQNRRVEIYILPADSSVAGLEQPKR